MTAARLWRVTALSETCHTTWQEWSSRVQSQPAEWLTARERELRSALTMADRMLGTPPTTWTGDLWLERDEERSRWQGEWLAVREALKRLSTPRP